jgi:hypothetical protein
MILSSKYRSRLRSRGAQFLGLGILGTLACSLDAGPHASDRLSGYYPLLSYEGKTLPAIDFEIPGRDGHGTGCFAVVTGGELGLDPTGPYFLINVRREDSCGFTKFWGPAIAEGSYSQEHQTLSFSAPAGPGRIIRFSGTITATTIAVADSNHRYTFSR